MSEHDPERFPAFVIDDVSEHAPDLVPEQASEHRVNRLSGWGSLEVIKNLSPARLSQRSQKTDST